jgi:hypothetical protein
VPDLSGDDPCRTLEKQYVPTSAVRQINLPPTNYNLIALAPWFSANCSRSYLASARLDPIRAFIFYQPSNSSAKPPDGSAPDWSLGDEGAWKSLIRYPVYAVPGIVGVEMMAQLGQYSGNLTEVPFGDNISALYNPDPADYVRIWTMLSVSTQSNLPNMWVFILAVVGVLVLVVVSTICAMHLTWRGRRNALRRRVMNGEVNLEAQGIKRLTVPVSHVEKFPLFTYNYDPPSVPNSPTSVKSARRGRTRSGRTMTIASAESAKKSAAPADGADLGYQPSCHICLEDFVHLSSIIRELPCGHIYHPDCIDDYLSRISSICPICKASMLPRGYCPPVSNSMVRRELATRKLRDRVVVDDDDVEAGGRRSRMHSWGSGIKEKIFGAVHAAPTPAPETTRQQAPPPRTDSAKQPKTEPQRRRRHDSIAEEGPAPEINEEQRPQGGEEEEEGGGAGGGQDAEAARERRMRELAGPDIESDDGNIPTCESCRVQRDAVPCRRTDLFGQGEKCRAISFPGSSNT